MPLENNEQNDDRDSSEGLSWAEKMGEALGRGLVKAIVGGLLAAGVLGGGSYYSNRQAVGEAERHEQWVGTNFMSHTQRENLLQSNLDELHGELKILQDQVYLLELNRMTNR